MTKQYGFWTRTWRRILNLFRKDKPKPVVVPPEPAPVPVPLPVPVPIPTPEPVPPPAPVYQCGPVDRGRAIHWNDPHTGKDIVNFSSGWEPIHGRLVELSMLAVCAWAADQWGDESLRAAPVCQIQTAPLNTVPPIAANWLVTFRHPDLTVTLTFNADYFVGDMYHVHHGGQTRSMYSPNMRAGDGNWYLSRDGVQYRYDAHSTDDWTQQTRTQGNPLQRWNQ